MLVCAPGKLSTERVLQRTDIEEIPGCAQLECIAGEEDAEQHSGMVSLSAIICDGEGICMEDLLVQACTCNQPLCRRKSYKPHEIRWDDIAKEATGKLFVMPRTDKHGRIMVILRPR